jgi:hypothetical protein
MAGAGAVAHAGVMPSHVDALPALRRLRLVLRREAEPTHVEPVDPPVAPTVEFVAYAEDCLLSGYVASDFGRLTDLLDEHEELELVDVNVRDLNDSPGMQVAEIVVQRGDLLLIHASGPRGDRGRRRQTRRHPVALQTGPYHVRGYLHVLPGADPITSFRRRRTMVPLTDASIEFGTGATRERRRVGTVIVNRDLIDWIVEAVEDEVKMPELPLSAQPEGGLAKDFTGEVLAG